MNKAIILALGGILCSSQLMAQSGASAPSPAKTDAPPPPPAFSLKISGFVRNDIMFDSRQIAGSREADLVLYPADKSLVNGKDQNDKASFTMNPITSRLSLGITGPDAFGAKTSGVLELDFFGATDATTNLARLRHAYAKLNWTKTELLTGQFWHPMFVTDCFPATVAYQTVIPINQFSRNPQVRLTQKVAKNVSIIVAALSQNEVNISPGPLGTAGTYGTGDSWSYLANNVIPELHAQAQYKSSTVIGGAYIDSKTIRPVVAYDGTVAATSYGAYLRINTKKVVLKTQYSMVQNAHDLVMLGGYVQYGTNTATTSATYKATNTSSFWAEIHGTGKKIVPGIVFAYSGNLGTNGTITDGGATSTASFGRKVVLNGRSIANLTKIMPRVDFISGKFRIGIEADINTAVYGTTGADAKVIENDATKPTESFTNTRLLVATVYSF